jgi:hypothetical protein
MENWLASEPQKQYLLNRMLAQNWPQQRHFSASLA